MPRARTQIQTQDEPASHDQVSRMPQLDDDLCAIAPYTKLTYSLTYTKLTKRQEFGGGVANFARFGYPFGRVAAILSICRGGTRMRNAVELMKRLQQDERGATLVEYTVLLGIMLVAVITTIGLVGGWMSTKWTALYQALSTN